MFGRAGVCWPACGRAGCGQTGGYVHTSHNPAQANPQVAGRASQEILDAACLISERGYNGTSIQDVADAVGVTKQGVLRYFPSKDNLLAAVYHEN